MAEKPRVIALMGPTASGKTALALDWAQQAPIEIINMDSALIYRAMDIGTAKPTAEERAKVPHHLIDILEPYETYSAAQFVDDAHRLVSEIHSRGATPVLVGGTMMYFRALTQGLADLPASVPSLRTALQQEVDEQGIAALHAKLAKVDAQSAKRLNPMDTQRVMRAYEVYLSSGKSMTAWLSEQQAIELPWVLQKIALIPQDRSWLHQRIALRLAQMREAGFLNEVKQLYARGDLGADMTAMRSVGYRQVWQFLAGEWDEETAWEKALVATRQLAKRQLTWLRSERDLHTVVPEDLATKKEIFSPFV